jgi:hypothetical protein
MRRTVAGALALLALLPAVRALDSPPKPAGTPAEQYKALVAEFTKSMADFMKEYQAAKPEERQKLFKEKYPNPDKFADRFLALAEKHPKDGAAVDALVWVVSNSRNAAKGGPREKALGLLKREYLQSDKLGPLCASMSRSFDKESRELLQTVLDKNPNAGVKAAACLALATNFQSRASLAKRFKTQPAMAKAYEGMLGKEGVEEIEKKGEEGLKKDAVKYLERVVKDFPDAKDEKGNPLGKEAKNKIDGILHPVEVGKAAPEIAGEDTDGKAFKLSDYKGKVVLLDFWGNW